MTTKPTIGIAMPVGPAGHYAQYIEEAIGSLAAQTRRPDQVVFVDDMHGLENRAVQPLLRAAEIPAYIYRPPWRLGVCHGFNHAVAIGHHRFGCDLMLMMGDDWLQPNALRALEETYLSRDGAEGYYHLSVLYSDGQGVQSLPCNAAAVTPAMWRETGGMPLEGAAGQMDAAYISQLLRNRPQFLIPVDHSAPDSFYVWRVHPDMESSRTPPSIGSALIEIRNAVTLNWRPTDWGRYE